MNKKIKINLEIETTDIPLQITRDMNNNSFRDIPLVTFPFSVSCEVT